MLRIENGPSVRAQPLGWVGSGIFGSPSLAVEERAKVCGVDFAGRRIELAGQLGSARAGDGGEKLPGQARTGIGGIGVDVEHGGRDLLEATSVALVGASVSLMPAVAAVTRPPRKNTGTSNNARTPASSFMSGWPRAKPTCARRGRPREHACRPGAMVKSTSAPTWPCGA